MLARLLMLLLLNAVPPPTCIDACLYGGVTHDIPVVHSFTSSNCVPPLHQLAVGLWLALPVLDSRVRHIR